MAVALATAIIGKEYPPFAFTVERGKIKEFARAIGDLSPFYLDDEAGRASLGVDIGRVLHGEQEFEQVRPITPGETLLCRTRVVDVYEKPGRSGPLGFVVREMNVTDRDNEIVATMRQVTVVRL